MDRTIRDEEPAGRQVKNEEWKYKCALRRQEENLLEGSRKMRRTIHHRWLVKLFVTNLVILSQFFNRRKPSFAPNSYRDGTGYPDGA